MPSDGRRRALVVAQLIVVALLVGFAAREVARGWGSLRPAIAGLEPRWGLLAASSALVLAAYLLLIQVWRAVVASWSSRLPLADAGRIWFVSNLGKYVPGKVWQIGAMGILAQRAGVSGVAAVGSSLVINLVNILTGLAVVVVAGVEAVEIPGADPATSRRAAYAALAVGLLALALAPLVLPRLVSAVGRATGRELPPGRVPPRAIAIAVAGTAAAWVMYGIAFELFAAGLALRTAGAASAYVAVYTGSYLIGYLTLIVPGGVGVRESSLIFLMPKLGLATAAQATVIALASRLWLTVLEVLPGLLFLARPSTRRRLRTAAEDASP